MMVRDVLVSMNSYFASQDVSTHLSCQIYVEGIANANSENTETGEAAARCVDSEMTLKEQISKLDSMKLVGGNECDCNKM